MMNKEYIFLVMAEYERGTKLKGEKLYLLISNKEMTKNWVMEFHSGNYMNVVVPCF